VGAAEGTVRGGNSGRNRAETPGCNPYLQQLTMLYYSNYGMYLLVIRKQNSPQNPLYVYLYENSKIIFLIRERPTTGVLDLNSCQVHQKNLPHIR
jgi:hypothetical protein